MDTNRIETIEESYRLISLWCRPLARTRYRTSELRRAKIKPDGEGSTTLLRKVRERERAEMEASAVLSDTLEHDEVFDEYTSALSTTSESYARISQRDQVEEAKRAASKSEAKEAAGRQRLRRIRDRISDAVFDYSEIEQEKIEERIDELVNSDGYYNEVEPIDLDSDYQGERQVNKPLLIAIIIFIIYVILIFKF